MKHSPSPPYQEGEAFLEAQGMAVTDDDVKTRNQKEKLEEIESEGGPPKVARAGTMAVTAEVRGGIMRSKRESVHETNGTQGSPVFNCIFFLGRKIWV